MNKMFKLSGVAAALILSGVLVGCGSSSSDSGTTPTPTPPTPTPTQKQATVTVVDGLVVGANVTAGVNTVESNAQGVAADVNYTGTTPTFSSTGGTTAAGLKAPNMKSAILADGTAIINPYTTLKAEGGNVTQLLSDLKLEISESDALANYTETNNSDFAKATVAYARVLYCANAANANDNSTKAAAAFSGDSGVSGSTTTEVLQSVASGDNKAKAAVAAAAAATGATVDAVEAEVKATLGTSDGCASTTPTPPDTNGSVVEI